VQYPKPSGRTAVISPLTSLLLFALLIPNKSVPQTQTPPGGVQSTPRVVEIKVRGNRVLNPEGIVGTSGLKVGGPLTKTLLDQAVRNLVSTGLYGARHLDEPEKAVIISARVDPATNTASVTIDVEENEIVRNFNITGSGPLHSREVIDGDEAGPNLKPQHNSS
jgi:outer membrane protein assembly factor BamA